MSSFFNVKTLVLIALCLQNSGFTLLRKYILKYERVSTYEVLLVSELIKLVVSVYIVYMEEANERSKALPTVEEIESQSKVRLHSWPSRFWPASNLLILHIFLSRVLF